jgi:tRNA(Ile2) C34 agmatinyltransferase TiaS
MTEAAIQRINIFDAVHTAITSKSKKQLRFAKCPRCTRHTPYRLGNLGDSGLRCKSCGTRISLYYHQ